MANRNINTRNVELKATQLFFADMSVFDSPQEFLTYMWNSKQADNTFDGLVASVLAEKKKGAANSVLTPEGKYPLHICCQRNTSNM